MSDTVSSEEPAQQQPQGSGKDSGPGKHRGKIYGGAMNINASIVDPVSSENVHGLIQHLVAHASLHMFTLTKELILNDPITNRLFNTFMRRMPPVVQAVVNSGAEFSFQLVVVPSEDIQYELHLKTVHFCNAVPRPDGGFDVYEAKPAAQPQPHQQKNADRIIIPGR